jgi:hypothetical protein
MFERNIFGRLATPCASPPPWPSIFSDYFFLVHHLVNRDDWHTLHVQWPLTSQLHGSFLKETNWFFCYGSNSLPRKEHFLKVAGLCC